MKMAPSVFKAVTKSISAYRGIQASCSESMQSYSKYMLRKPSLITFKEFKQVNLPTDKKS